MRTHEVVLEHLEEQLSAGRLTVGDRLPGERALAEQLGVSRPSVREAVRVLEAMGVIRTAAGSGPDAGAVVIADTATGITQALRLHMATSQLSIADLVQTRVLLESWAVSVADASALEDARALLLRMDRPDLAAEEFHLLDAEFHVALCAATGNTVVAAVMASLRGAIHGYVMASVPSLPDWPATARLLRRQHRGIVRAIDAGEPARAARLVTAHITGFYRATALS